MSFAKGLRKYGRGAKPSLQRAAFASIALFAVLAVAYALGLAGVYDLTYAANILPRLLSRGFVGTLGLVVIVIPVGFALGFTLGWGRTSGSPAAREISTAYVEFFRGLPPVVLIFFAFLITLVLLRGNERFEATEVAPAIAILVLAAHSGAYQAEIIRAGILSVPSGQREAGEAIGLTKGQVILHVTLPQMFRVSLPALGNEFASVIKDTSLLSIVGVLDLTLQGTDLVSQLVTYLGRQDLVFVVWFEIAALYFVLTFIVSRVLLAVERRYRVPGLEAAQL
jgi:polar amino acid transport system permease protein